ASGLLHLLLAALHFDVGEREVAEASRDAALHLGRETRDREVQAWAFETSAYFAIFERRPREAIDLARAGRELAPAGTSAFAAVSMQEARAFARLGDRAAAEAALLRG